MKLLNNLEKKIGRFAIHNLIIYILACYIIGFVLSMTQSEMLNMLTLEPGLILQGQVWRLISWVLVPPGAVSIFIIFMILFYYFAGSALERAWGAFRFNVYIFSGLIFTVLGAFLLFFITGSRYLVGGFFSTNFISTSLLLAFAATFPDQEIRLYLVLPLKVKWLGVIFAVPIVWQFITGSTVNRVAIVSSLLNFLIFFVFTLRPSVTRLHPKDAERRAAFKREVKPKESKENKTHIHPRAKHKCATCGRTDIDHPELEFRYCSKCKGNLEYCQDHLFTHTHKQ